MIIEIEFSFVQKVDLNGVRAILGMIGRATSICFITLRNHMHTALR